MNNFMRQSELFTKTRKESPAGEEAKNAKLLIRAGYLHKEMAGVYSYLPLGLLALNKIIGIIRREMNEIGGQEVFLSALQDPEVWKKTGRWSDEVFENWFKTKIKTGGEAGLSFTHEEPLSNLMKNQISSFRDLPRYVYQFQTKFRNEPRARSGIIRGREFLMKDLYSFSRNQKEHEMFYEKAKQAYQNIFADAGIGAQTYITYASGGSFSKYSHEFQTVTDAGEDTIYLCENCRVAVNKEIFAEQNTCPKCGAKVLAEKRAVEVGNIFSLGTRFSEAFDLNYLDEKGDKKLVVMGSYGIGPSRLLGAIVEVLADEKGIVWPKTVAPFQIHLIAVFDENGKVQPAAEKLYNKLLEKGIETLFDDRNIRAGEKFADADLIGIPLRVVISEKTLKENKIEIKERAGGEIKMVSESELIKTCA
ncbi:MAG: Prolyl-tRNA synthetase [Parcubacteria group bacterium GW2011_GWB1_44_7]|nr:MAG: Prolyl-tRNA synthetase [Parcubacteria group bacterium GW2011_GWB1_44_7]